MKTCTSSLLTFVLLATVRIADAAVVTSPPGSNGSTKYPFLSGPDRYQQVYAASDFTATIPTGGTITAMAFRPASTVFNAAEITNIDIRFSTTLATPSSLSPIFANNAGSDETTVISGPLHFYGPPGDGFTIILPFSAPFLYEPSRGNLLMDVRTSGTGGLFIQDDTLAADFRSNNSASFVASIFSSSDPVNAQSGDVFTNFGLVTQFTIIPVPEPSSAVLGGTLGIGLVSCTVIVRRRNERRNNDETR